MVKSTFAFLAVAFVLPGASGDAFGQNQAVQAPMAVIEFVPGGAAIQVAGQAADGEDPRAAAFRAQFEPLVKIQLSFANRVCRWTKEQRVAAIAAANAWLTEYARESAKNNIQQQFGGGIMLIAGDVPGGAAVPPVETKLQEKLQGAMTQEQRAEYDAQRAKRDAFRTEAAIENIVAQMDRLLSLTPEQHRKVRDSLRESWKDNWEPQLEVFIHMTEYAPAFPDEKVLPHLTPAQRDVWSGVQRISVHGVNFGGGLGGNAPPIDDVDLGEGSR